MSEPRHNVLGIGNAIVDVISRTTDEFLSSHDIPKGGMNLIDEARAEELYADTGPSIEISGGSAANTIVGVASFGGTGAYVGKVKDDQLGKVFSHDIRASGVTFETALAGEGPSTARSLILVTPDGERTMNTYLGACVQLGPQDLDADLIASAQVTYLEGYLWDPEAAKEAFREAARIARAAGRKVSLTLSDPFCVERHREGFLELVKGNVDILFANELEIMSLYQVDDFDEAAVKVKADCELAALTRSEKGCVVVSGDHTAHVPAVPVKQVVDTTGAGDMFAAGFLYGVTHGRDLETCGKLGVLAASEIISHVGARPETPFADLARQHGLD
ncbi:MAG: adenosine kinase [Alphaproteobacteria bacterium]|nr:adenosine kinase [Alphaproteobacteria bacterium]